MRLFTTPDWIYALGAGPVSEMTLHLGLYEAFARGEDGMDTPYVADYLQDRVLPADQVEDYVSRRRRLALGPPSTDPLPVVLDRRGRFELDGDGHHRAVRHVFEGSERVSVNVRSVSPLWQQLVDNLLALYPTRERYLYQEIEHPYFAGWDLSRAPARLDTVMEALRGADLLAEPDEWPTLNALEVGSCTGRFCRELARAGQRVFGIDSNARVVAVAEYLNFVFRTSKYDIWPTYWNTGIGDPLYQRLLMGGDGWNIIVCLSVLHAYHTMGRHDWVKAVLRQLLDRTRCLITDCDAPDRTFQGGASWPEAQYREWLIDICDGSHTLEVIGKSEARTIYLLLRK